MTACLILNENGGCVGYLNMELVTGLIIALVIFWGLFHMFKILLNQLK